MPDPAPKPLLFDAHGHVAVITLNRPEVRNAINGALAAAMDQALDELETNPKLRVAIITAAGSVFSSDADLAAVETALRAKTPSGIITKKGGFAGIARRQRRKPIIAALQGDAIAGGFEIALACDLVLAAQDIKFALPEASRSLVATAGALIRLPRLIGLNRAQQMILTGAPINAETARKWGVVNEVLPPAELFSRAMALAEGIAEQAPLAIQANRSLAAMAYDLPSDELFRAGFQEGNTVMASKDAAEGTRAFLEKRPPVWSGE